MTAPAQPSARQRLEAALQAHGHPVDAPATLIDPESFQAGMDLAYDRVLAFLQSLPEQSATRTRDEGRGVSHAVSEIRQAIVTLRDDRPR